MFRTAPFSDAMAVRRVLRGDANAFGPLVRRYHRAVIGLCYGYLRNRADAEDAAQEAFIRAYTRLNTLADPARFGPWLMIIARNASLNGQAKHRTAAAALRAAGQAASTAPADSKERAMDDARIDALLAEHLAQLPDDHREVLTLHYYAGNDTREIARILDISREAAKKRLQRSRDLLGANLLPALQAEAAQGRLSEERLQRLVRTVIAVPVPWLAVAASAGAFGGTALAAAGLGASAIVAAAAAWWFVPGDATPAPSLVEPPLIVEANTGWTLREPSVASASTAPSSAIGIAGRVVDGTTNQPITGFRIRALHEARISNPYIQTEDAVEFYDVNGEFNLPVRFPGTYALLVAAEGFVRKIIPDIVLDLGENQTDVLISMRRGKVLSGNVVDLEGVGVAGLEIQEHIQTPQGRASIITDTTDSRGRFTVTSADGEWPSVYPDRSEYQVLETVRDGETITFIVYKGGIIEGIATRGGQPVPGDQLSVSMSTGNGAIHPAHNGTYRIESVLPGEHDVTLVITPPYKTAPDNLPIYTGKLETTRRARVEDGKITRLDFDLPAEAFVEGRATVNGGPPPTPVYLQLLINSEIGAQRHIVYTDDEGRFRISANAEGEAALIASVLDDLERPLSVRTSAILRPGFTTPLDIDLGAGGRIVGTLLGYPETRKHEVRPFDVVLLFPQESPFDSLETIASATFEQLRDASFGLNAVESSAYATPIVPPGRYTLFAFAVQGADAFATVPELLAQGVHALTEVEIVDGEETRLDLQLRPLPPKR